MGYIKRYLEHLEPCKYSSPSPSPSQVSYSMPKTKSLPIFLLALTGAMAWKDQCNTFTIDSPGVQLVKATYYEASAFVNVSSFQQTLTTSKLPAFCRLQLNLTTNPDTGKAAYSELWLPDDWNSRTLGFGNGGWSGGGTTFQNTP